jgi:hypothetical protein
MPDDITHQDRLERNPPSGLRGILQSKEPEAERGMASCKAFGYHLGPEHLSAVEFRFLNGDSMWFPYSSMGACRHIPSEGLLLKFSGDLVYLVLIRGSNLDRGIDGKALDLIHGGLQRHHVLWLREMTPTEIREVGETGPTIDRIEVAEFESHAALQEWLKAKAPAFAQGAGVGR